MRIAVPDFRLQPRGRWAPCSCQGVQNGRASASLFVRGRVRHRAGDRGHEPVRIAEGVRGRPADGHDRAPCARIPRRGGGAYLTSCWLKLAPDPIFSRSGSSQRFFASAARCCSSYLSRSHLRRGCSKPAILSIAFGLGPALPRLRRALWRAH
jgi:hypothetical protein